MGSLVAVGTSGNDPDVPRSTWGVFGSDPNMVVVGTDPTTVLGADPTREFGSEPNSAACTGTGCVTDRHTICIIARVRNIMRVYTVVIDYRYGMKLQRRSSRFNRATLHRQVRSTLDQ